MCIKGQLLKMPKNEEQQPQVWKTPVKKLFIFSSEFTNANDSVGLCKLADKLTTCAAADTGNRNKGLT